MSGPDSNTSADLLITGSVAGFNLLQGSLGPLRSLPRQFERRLLRCRGCGYDQRRKWLVIASSIRAAWRPFT